VWKEVPVEIAWEFMWTCWPRQNPFISSEYEPKSSTFWLRNWLDWNEAHVV